MTPTNPFDLLEILSDLCWQDGNFTSKRTLGVFSNDIPEALLLCTLQVIFHQSIVFAGDEPSLLYLTIKGSETPLEIHC